MTETVHIEDDGTPRELDELPAQGGGEEEDDEKDEGGEAWKPITKKLTKSLESQAETIDELRAKQAETDRLLKELQSKPESSPPEPTPRPPEPEPTPKTNEPEKPEPEPKKPDEPKPAPAPAPQVRKRRAI